MGRSKVGTRPHEFKYGMALYGAAWPEGDHYYVCGGGGHGLVPRIVWAQYKNGRCSDQIGEYKLGKDTPMRMMMCPWGTSLLLGSANGGIRRLQIGSTDPQHHTPKLVEVSAAFQESLHALNDEVGTMAFNAAGNLLAVGFKEGAGLRVLSYPSMRLLMDWRLSDPEVKDLDFVHTPGLDAELLASVAGDGSCVVWQLSQEGPQQVVQLEPPSENGKKGRFIRCRFSRGGEAPLLFTLLNVGRDTSLLAAYTPQAPGQPWQLLRKVRAKDQPASAMDISKHGEWIAAGFADGTLKVFNTDAALSRRAEAEVSIAFVSSVAFNGDNTAVIAVGGDANCFVLELAPRRGAGGGGGLGCCGALGLLLLLAVVAAGFIIVHFATRPQELPYAALELLQQLSRSGHLNGVCSGHWPPGLCSWLQQALASLPPSDDAWAEHDEL